jgi:hypothetical protein
MPLEPQRGMPKDIIHYFGFTGSPLLEGAVLAPEIYYAGNQVLLIFSKYPKKVDNFSRKE